MPRTVQLLDNGYLKFIEHWGSDERIIEAARMSVGKGFLGWEPGPCPIPIRPGEDTHGNCTACEGKGTIRGDKHLLRFLWENKHHTPFEMAGLTIEVQAPIMVFREWHRHRVPFGYNEASARYAPLPDMNYIPTPERCLRVSAANKQAGAIKGAAALDLYSAVAWLAELADVYEHAERVYQSGLQRGIPKELARLPVPVGRYSKMRATGNVRGWISGFLALRMAANAQEEIRVYAEALGGMIAVTFPRTWELFMEGRAR